MNAWSIKKQITVLAAVFLFFFLALGANSLWQQSIIKQGVTNLEEDALPGVEILPKVFGEMLEIRGSTLLVSLSDTPTAQSARLAKLSTLESLAATTLRD